MVKKTKSKSRLDKYYQMAKSTGYRSRAAFKLIQLNKKFEFLNSAHVLVDLCAAPGGWLQVAAAKMPVNSLIIGADLVPIKPIQGVISFVGDITKQACFARIKSEIRNMKADVVLHDGAPNVGQSWEQDAFSQNELVLSSLKLASKILKPGGVFVTKVFRSVDYNSLLSTFNQVFNKVNATKPMASRSTSAEIFVVCTGFNPKEKVNLDPKFVFMESDDIVEKHNVYSLKQLVPEKVIKRKPIDESRGTAQFRKTSVSRFVECENPYQFLADNDELTALDDDSVRYMSMTSLPKNFSEYCKDLRVLGRPEMKTFIRWRKKILNLTKTPTEKPAPSPEEVNSDEEIQNIIAGQAKLHKKKLKKQREKEKKIVDSKLTTEEGNEEDLLFTSQNPILAGQDIEEIEYTDPEDEEEEVFYEDDEELEEAFSYPTKRRKMEEEPMDEESAIKSLVEESIKKETAARWFQRKEFKAVDDFSTEFKNTKKKKKKDKKEKKQSKQDFEVVPSDYLETNEEIAETIALGTAMLRKKRRREIINWTYNRYNFEEETNDLPDWFAEDQKKHYTAPLPLTSEELKIAYSRVKELDKKPIKKVMEAIGRRKRKIAHRLESIKPKAEAIINQTDVSEGLKIKHMQRLYKKQIALSKPKKKYIVSRKVHRGKFTKKPGRNVKYVDKRLKKDKRANK